MKKLTLIACLFCLFSTAWAASDAGIKLQKPYIDVGNQAALQRGAKYYMQYCVSCHSLKYMRYQQLAQGLGLINKEGQLDSGFLQEYLTFTGAKIVDPIRNAMSKSDADQWFGMAPPDLSLIARERGVDWLYTYLLSFYADPNRLIGTNNLLFPDVAMPNVLEGLQGVQVPVYKRKKVAIDGQKQKINEIDHLKLLKKGTLTPKQFDQVVQDLVNFLSYVGEPKQLTRIRIGVWVIAFLLIFIIVAYLLKVDIWRGIKK